MLRPQLKFISGARFLKVPKLFGWHKSLCIIRTRFKNCFSGPISYRFFRETATRRLQDWLKTSRKHRIIWHYTHTVHKSSTCYNNLKAKVWCCYCKNFNQSISTTFILEEAKQRSISTTTRLMATFRAPSEKLCFRDIIIISVWTKLITISTYNTTTGFVENERFVW